MPNHTYVVLEVHGTDGNKPSVIIPEVNGSEDDHQFSLKKILPIKVGENQWDVWGTKWDTYDQFSVNDKWKNSTFEGNWEITEDRIRIGFHTAWSPPLPVIVFLSKKYPKLIFKCYYADECCSYVGLSTIQDGLSTDNKPDWKYKSPNNEVINLLREMSAYNIWYNETGAYRCD